MYVSGTEKETCVKLRNRLWGLNGRLSSQERWMIKLAAAQRKVAQLVALHAAAKKARENGGRARMEESEGRAWKATALQAMLRAAEESIYGQVTPLESDPVVDEVVASPLMSLAPAPLVRASSSSSVAPLPVPLPLPSSLPSSIPEVYASVAPMMDAEVGMRAEAWFVEARNAQQQQPQGARAWASSPFDFERSGGAALDGEGSLAPLRLPNHNGAHMVNDADLFAELDVPQRSSSIGSLGGGGALLSSAELHAHLRASPSPSPTPLPLPSSMPSLADDSSEASDESMLTFDAVEDRHPWDGLTLRQQAQQAWRAKRRD
jgi:hypothetical protein